jgi:biotin carboxyl carrier protein
LTLRFFRRSLTRPSGSSDRRSSTIGGRAAQRQSFSRRSRQPAGMRTAAWSEKPSRSLQSGPRWKGSSRGAQAGKSYMVRVAGRTFTLDEPQKGRARSGAAGGDGAVRAPMTGTVLAVSCKVGDAVTADQTLVVVTAMKMEHKLVAGVAGVVKRVDAAVGGTVEQGAVLVEVEPQKETQS